MMETLNVCYSQLSGQVVRKRYKIGMEIGAGSFGSVFDVYDLKSKQNLVMKISNQREQLY